MFALESINDHFKQGIRERLGQSVLTLRDWQKMAMDLAREKTETHKSSQVFVVTACPAAGKTTFGCVVAANDVVYSGSPVVVVCLVPSLSIKTGWVDTAKRLGLIATGDPDNFTEDVMFRVVTYSGAKQALKNIAPGSKIFLICDEYHHAEREREWGLGLATIADSAYKVLMLSGTPWRSEGYIALLEDNHYYKDGKVIPDYAYSYSQDLSSSTRGTVPLHFELLHSRALQKVDGQMEVISEYLHPITDEDWEEMSTNMPTQPSDLGKHIRCENVYKNQTAVNLLNRVRVRLEDARNEHCPYAIALVVTRSKNEANNVGAYLRSQFGWTVSVIHSGDEENDSRSCRKIKQIQDELKKVKPSVPDAIVSVGMISEGVDIPAIKVVGYLSAISTLLYLVQVFFRAARRIPKYFDEKGTALPGIHYWDDGSPTMAKPGYIIAPAEPTIVYLSANLKKEISQSVKVVKESEILREVEKTQSEPREYLTESKGRVNVSNSCFIPPDVEEGIRYLPDCPSVVEMFCGREEFEQWVKLVFASNDEAKQQALIKRIRKLQEDYSQEYFKAVQSHTNIKTPLSGIDYDAQIEEVKCEVQRITNKIRHSTIKTPNGTPFCRLSHEEAYPLINTIINRKIGIKTLKSSTLATRINWINAAEDFYKEGMKNG